MFDKFVDSMLSFGDATLKPLITTLSIGMFLVLILFSLLRSGINVPYLSAQTQTQFDEDAYIEYLENLELEQPKSQQHDSSNEESNSSKPDNQNQEFNSQYLIKI